RFVERADQHESPKAVHDSPRLAVLLQPIAKGRVGIYRYPPQTVQPPGNAKFFPETQVMGAQEAAGEMKRRGEPAGLEAANPAVGRNEIQTGLGAKQVGYAQGAEEVREVRAAAHADVLAGIDELPRRTVRERAGAPSQPTSRFQQRNAEPAR